ncbi:hypothetical protein ARD30_07290 [Bosea thiooxidans]|uniref:Uncharacterized protein n=1 Tax=Bosea thiooxidans TaxID=53254 RepID=A0A0Q3L5Z4_9HYPH|nr:hypothetical protein [Bosea thiooxidans]KQK32180.1 hypothetical protein ARD30_07290 [Bosea thiooxidans]SKB37443.1 hypothetical protein SAMN05660750_00414 [Bosea thiooxidans]
MSIRFLVPFVIAASASFAGLTGAQAQPCATNFSSSGVPMVSQITYRTWDLSKKAPATVLPAIVRAIQADGDFMDIRVDKASGTISAVQEVTGSGRPQILKVNARKQATGTRIDIAFTVQPGQIAPEAAVRKGLCDFLRGAR